jgi:hypothetical protein
VPEERFDDIIDALSGFEDILTAPMALFAGVRPPVADTDMPQVQWQESPPRIVSPSGAPQVRSVMMSQIP